MKKIKESETKRWLLNFALIVAGIFVYKSFGSISEVLGLFKDLWKILIPFIVAFGIAYFLSRPVNFFERQFKKIINPKPKFLSFFNKHSRVFSIIIVYIIFVGALTLLCYAIFPELVSGISALIGNVDAYFDTAQELVASFTERFPLLGNIDLGDRILEWAEGLIKSIDLNTITGTIQSVTGVGSTVVNIILSIFVSIYMLGEKEKIFGALRRICSLFMKEKALNNTALYLRRADKVVYTYFTAQFFDCVLVSIFATIALAILKAPSPMVLGFIFGMMNIIPYFGPIIGGVVVVFVILVSRGFMLALWSAIILLVLQQIDANVINPRVLGNSLDMSPFWVIFSITVGGGLFGFGGMLLGVPTVAVLRLIYRDLLVRRRKKLAQLEAEAKQEAETSDNAEK